MWQISWSWQAPMRIATITSVEGGVLVSSGLDLFMLESNADLRWKAAMPFKVHNAVAADGKIGILAAHGFYVLSSATGKLLSEGRSCPEGFQDILARPGGGWILSGRDGNLHLFNTDGRGIKRLDSGRVRRLIGWLDREHILWQANDGRIWCARLAQEDKKRCLEDKVWSWTSRLAQGRMLLQSSDGQIFEGIPHPFGWDGLSKVECDSIEVMSCVRSADGWWVLGIEGNMHHLSGEGEEVTLGQGMDLGDLLVGLTPDTMVSATRDGLIRKWSAPHLAQGERQSHYKAAADAAMARNWEERRAMFQRARDAEDEGRLSLALEYYQALGREEDVKRLLRSQREEGA